MTFSVEIFDKSTQYWASVSATFVYPFSWAEKLDESLDEAQIVCYNSTVKKYKPNTNWRIIISDGTNTKTLLYKLANDVSENYPNGSQTYKHTISLVEMTKYLEGVMCQTLTFTNTLGKSYSARKASFYITHKTLPISLNNYSGTSEIVSPRTSNTIDLSQAIRDAGESINEITAHVQAPETPAYFEAYDAEQGRHSSVTFKSETGRTVTYNYHGVDPTGGIVAVDSDFELDFTLLFRPANIPATTPSYIVRISYYVAYVPSLAGTKKYTIKSVCERIFRLAEPLYGAETPRFSLDSTQADDLDEILAPEFTMSQSTLREQLKVVGSHIHAEPRIVDFSFVDGKPHYTVGFEHYCKSPKIAAPSYSYKHTYSYNLANYCTRIHTNARNVVNSLSKGHTITDPGKGSFKGLRAEQANVRISDSNGIVKTAEPIYDLTACKCGIFQSNGYSIVPPYDITQFCFEATEYDSVLSSYSGSYPRSKIYAIRWKRGEKNITQLFYKAPNVIHQALSNEAIANILSIASGIALATILGYLDASTHPDYQLVFQVQYKPITNTAFIHGKNEYSDEEPYTTAYNQSDSLVELDYYGENIRGAAARMGNADCSITAEWNSIFNLPQIGYRMEWKSEEYYISDLTFELNAERILGTIGLTKDFNRISQYIGVNSQKRISEISTDQAYDRDVILEAKVVVGNPANAKTPRISVPIAAYKRLFNAPTEEEDLTVSQCGIERDNGLDKTILPAIASGYGTATVLTASMKDNYASGETEKYYSDENIRGFWQNDYQFGDYFGRANTIGVKFGGTFYQSNRFAFSYPQPSDGFTPNFSVGTINKYKCLKDSRERLATIAVSIEAQTTIPDLTLGSAIAKLNGLVVNNKWNNQWRIPRVWIVPVSGVLPYKLSETIICCDRTGWIDFGNVQITDVGNDKFYINSVRWLRNVSARGFVIAYTIGTKTETVIDESGNEVEQTTYHGGEILMVSSRLIPPNTNILGQEYTFRIE